MSHDIKELSRAELEQWCLDNGHTTFRARQVLRWLYRHGTTSFADMSDVSVALREHLAAVFSIGRLACVRTSAAADGTRKYLFGLADGRRIESVLIPAPGRQTLCISSQFGCAMGCQFCATARMRPVRNLTAGEIVGQVWESSMGWLPTSN